MQQQQRALASGQAGALPGARQALARPSARPLRSRARYLAVAARASGSGSGSGDRARNEAKQNVSSAKSGAKQGVDDTAKDLLDGGDKTRSRAKQNISGAADSVQDGIDDAADTAKDVLDGGDKTRARAKQNVGSAADSVQDGVDDAADTAKDLLDGGERTRSRARQGVNEAADGVQQGIDDAADTAKDLLDGGDKTRARAKQGISEGAVNIQAGIDDAADTAKDLLDDGDRARARARQGISEGAESAQEGVDQGAEALKDAISDGNRAAQEFADDFEARANAAADRLQGQVDDTSRRLERAIDEAPEAAANAVQQAVDGTAAGIKSAQQQLRELQQPGPPARFAATPLTSLEPLPFESRPGPKPAEDKQAEYYKRRLLYCVAGLDRGFAANAGAQAEVEATVASLLSVSDPVLLSWAPEEGKEASSLAQLNGTWRLAYSSSFAKGAGPPSPPGFKLGQVYQAIAAYSSRLDNIVEFYSTVSLPQLPGLPKSEPVVTTLALKHYFEAAGGSTARITFEDTEVKSTGGPNGILGRLPELTVPQLPEGLRPPRGSRSSTFETLYLDGDLRISRGARGELRVFLRT